MNLLDGQCWLSHSRLNQFIVQSLVNKMTHDIYYNGILKHNRFILFNCIFSKYLRHLCWTQFTFRSRFSNHKQVNIERNVIQNFCFVFLGNKIIFSILKYWQKSKVDQIMCNLFGYRYVCSNAVSIYTTYSITSLIT